MNGGSAIIAETRDEHAAGQMDGDVFEPVHLIEIPGKFALGNYEVLVEEEHLQWLSFDAFSRTATNLTVRSKGAPAERSEMRVTTDSDLKDALSRDAALNRVNNDSEAALSPLEALK